MGSLELKVPPEQLEACLQQVRTFSQADRRALHDKAPPGQRTLTARQEELHGLQALHRKWRAEQNLRPGGHNKGAKYTSNKTHYSPVDPDARIAVKPGKARRLCYHMQLSVDAGRHVITHMLADHSDRKDSRCLPTLLGGLTRRLRGLGFRCSALLADTGYSSGENYALLEQEGIAAFIPAHGKYRSGPEGFTYEREGDHWLCPEGRKATFRQEISKGNKARARLYRTTRQDCKGCPLKESCCGKEHEKRIATSSYRDEYERAIARGKSRWGRRMKRLRQATVEPVLGTLLNHMAMRKINTRGLQLAHKGMLVAAAAYNLQKLLHFTPRRSQTAVIALPTPEKRVFFSSFLGVGETVFENGIGSRSYLRLCNRHLC